jgi:N-acetylmuramoyl-L-alanine amidase
VYTASNPSAVLLAFFSRGAHRRRRRRHRAVALATAVHGTILRTVTPENKPCPTLDRGIKRARFSVLTGVKHPSILVECGFLSHPYEARLVHNEAYRNTMATGIAMAVLKYRGAVTRKPAAKP